MCRSVRSSIRRHYMGRANHYPLFIHALIAENPGKYFVKMSRLVRAGRVVSRGCGARAPATPGDAMPPKADIRLQRKIGR